MNESPRMCPVCGRSMEAGHYGRLEIDRCDCGQLWFDAEELAAYVSRWAGGDLAAEDVVAGGSVEVEGETLVCPRCRTPTLVPYRMVGQLLHRCTGCLGISMERGELERVLARAETEGHPGVGTRLREFLRHLFG